MSFVNVEPDLLSSAAGNLQGIGAGLAARNAAVADPTVGVMAPASDVVSGLTAAQFSAHALLYQLVAALGTHVHELFVQTLGASAASYTTTEAANAATTG